MTIKYLIVRFSSIGDIVLTTPVVRGLKEQVEDAEVHFLTKPQYADILENNPYIDKIHTLKSSYSKTVEELKSEKFDYIIDLHKNLRTTRLKYKLKVLDFSYNKINREKWLMVNFKKNKLPDKHIVDRYLETVSVFDVENDGKGLDYFIPQKDSVEPQSEFSLKSDKYISFGIGGQHNTKKLPVDMISEICKNIKATVLLLGGKEDFENGELISRATKNVINACGKYSINKSASILKQSYAVITHDTGLMHIAAAFNKPVLSIWGNTIPEFGMTPYMADERSKIFEVKNLKCRPCTKIGYKKCPKKHFRCMKDQDISGIADKANNLLAI